MSSYFFGGFSAYLIVPSGRQSNHSGCSLIHGWSGEALSAMSSAISSPCSRAAATRRSKSSRLPSSGWTARWPPSARADRVGAAGVVRPGRQRVVAALAVGAADRVDRREVEDVEAEVADVGQAGDHVVEGAVHVRVARLRPGEELVPGAERGRLAVGEDPQRLGAGEVGAGRGAPHRRRHARLAEDGEAGAVVLERLVTPERAAERRLVLARAVAARGERRLDQVAALHELERDVDAGRVLLGGVAAPGGEEVAPGEEAALVERVVGKRGLDLPAVVPEESHRQLVEGFAAGTPPDEGGVDAVVAVGEDVGLYRVRAAGDGLGGEAAPVDLDADALDREPRFGQGGEPFGGRLVRALTPSLSGWASGRPAPRVRCLSQRAPFVCLHPGLARNARSIQPSRGPGAGPDTRETPGGSLETSRVSGGFRRSSAEKSVACKRLV